MILIDGLNEGQAGLMDLIAAIQTFD